MLILYIFVFLLSFFLTKLIRKYALRHQVLDIPNQRSSHTIPTARGGGLAIVLAFTLANLSLFFLEQLTLIRLLAFSSIGLVALIGFIDDHQPVSARWRFLVHISTSALILALCRSSPELSLSTDSQWLNLGWISFILAILFLVWSLNLFNFMDGTDGLAGSEAVFVCLSLAAYCFDTDTSLSIQAMCLALATMGFLFWNWPKAKIFMGDVGSGFLGLALAVLIIMAAQQQAVLLYCGIILYGIFVVDASYTLCVRIITGQAWYEAHCSHTYQQLAKRHGHLRILLASWTINLCWLLPISYGVYLYPAYALQGLLIAYLPLLAIAYYYKAGQKAIGLS